MCKVFPITSFLLFFLNLCICENSENLPYGVQERQNINFIKRNLRNGFSKKNVSLQDEQDSTNLHSGLEVSAGDHNTLQSASNEEHSPGKLEDAVTQSTLEDEKLKSESTPIRKTEDTEDPASKAGDKSHDNSGPEDNGEKGPTSEDGSVSTLSVVKQSLEKSGDGGKDDPENPQKDKVEKEGKAQGELREDSTAGHGEPQEGVSHTEAGDGTSINPVSDETEKDMKPLQESLSLNQLPEVLSRGQQLRDPKSEESSLQKPPLSGVSSSEHPSLPDVTVQSKSTADEPLNEVIDHTLSTDRNPQGINSHSDERAPRTPTAPDQITEREDNGQDSSSPPIEGIDILKQEGELRPQSAIESTELPQEGPPKPMQQDGYPPADEAVKENRNGEESSEESQILKDKKELEELVKRQNLNVLEPVKLPDQATQNITDVDESVVEEREEQQGEEEEDISDDTMEDMIQEVIEGVMEEMKQQEDADAGEEENIDEDDANVDQLRESDIPKKHDVEGAKNKEQENENYNVPSQVTNTHNSLVDNYTYLADAKKEAEQLIKKMVTLVGGDPEIVDSLKDLAEDMGHYLLQ
ncbi:merozoite surface protein 3, putative [Plasmodium malariae]|uniref:Merozoite surface protein 3, putative n=1 Tax=Plasmodium malariae TaxID=5858 RepID=A0A1D3JK05_PLAMA|nr:merozoite surface protein 3, putative [Plasmodium malariae]SBT86729.1 merozoite surface protein 3, putative [Plasmodium malariae]